MSDAERRAAQGFATPLSPARVLGSHGLAQAVSVAPGGSELERSLGRDAQGMSDAEHGTAQGVTTPLIPARMLGSRLSLSRERRARRLRAWAKP